MIRPISARLQSVWARCVHGFARWKKTRPGIRRCILGLEHLEPRTTPSAAPLPSLLSLDEAPSPHESDPVSSLASAVGGTSAPGAAGPEFRVASGIASRDAKVAVAPNGDFAIVSSGDFDVYPGRDLFAQRYLADGRSVGSPFAISQFPTNDQRALDIELNANGDLVVLWRDEGLNQVSARAFNAGGTALTDQILVYQGVTGSVPHGSVYLHNDRFVAVWDRGGPLGTDDIFLREFPLVGSPGPQVQLNNISTGSDPKIAFSDSGAFIVAWFNVGEVLAREFRPAGSPNGNEFLVNSTTDNRQYNHDVAMDSDGDAIVVWNSYLQDGSGEGVYGQRLKSTPTGLMHDGPEFLVNEQTFDWQYNPEVGIDGDGNFTVMWESYAQDGSGSGVFARRFSALGVPLTDDLQINTRTTGHQSVPRMDVGRSGEFVVTWIADGSFGGEPGVFAQRFHNPRVDALDTIAFNDTRESATDLGTIVVPQGSTVAWIVRDFLSIDPFVTEADWFRFGLPVRGSASDHVLIDFFESQGSLNLDLFDAEGRLLRSATSLSDGKLISLTSLPAGVYFARVSGNPNPYYKFTLTATGAPTIDGAEPNDTPATPVPFVQPLTGDDFVDGLSIHQPLNDDWFEFQLDRNPANEHFLRVSFAHSSGDLDIDIYDVTGAQLLGRSATVSDEEVIGLAAAGLQAGTPYLLRVYGFAGATSPDYRIDWHAPRPLVADLGEPNDGVASPLDLGVISGSSTAVGITIHTSGDEDFFAFQTVGTGTDAHSIKLIAESSQADLRIQLYENGMVIRNGVATPAGAQISLAGLAAGPYVLGVFSLSGPDSYELTIDAPTQTASAADDWTILVYMAASDLSGRAENDIDELEQAVAALPGTVNVLVYLDQSQSGGFVTGDGAQAAWSDAGRAILIGDEDVSEIATTFELLGEQNSGARQTLEEFVRWGVNLRPADHYALIPWGHGEGVFGSVIDDGDPGEPEDRLSAAELDAALSELANVDGISFDLIAFDASLMGMAEVAHLAAEHAEVFVGSEMPGETGGFDYDRALAVLNNNPAGVSAEMLASQIVNTYKDRYSGRSTLSAFASTGFPALSQALADFSAAAQNGATVSDWEHIHDARSSARAFGGRTAFRDLDSFVRTIAANPAITQSIRDAAQAAHDALREVVIAEATNPQTLGGLSIYLPDDLQTQETNDYFALFEDFDTDTQWFGFLEELTNSTDSKAGTFDPDRFEVPERNDLPALAHDFGAISGRLDASSLTIDRTGDVDWFRFTISSTGGPANQLQLVHDLVDGAATSMQLTLFEDNELADQIGNSVDTQNGTGVFPLNGLSNGRYLARVQANGVVPRYTFSIDAPRVAAASDFAGDNSTMAKAHRLIGIAQFPLFSGLVLPVAPTPGQRSFDWFTFDGPQLLNAEPIQIAVVADTTSSIRLRLVRADGNEIDSATGTGRTELQLTFNPGVAYFIEVSATSTTAIGYSIDFSPVSNDQTGPRVTGVEVRSQSWPVAAGWIPVPDGADQLEPLSWVGVDQVRMVFSEDVSLAAGSLAIASVMRAYAVQSFVYNAATFTAAWTFDRAVVADRLRFDLSDAVVDRAGNALDGEWNNAGQLFPSGNGTIGGDFSYQLNVLPGSVDGNTDVNVLDLLLLRLRLGQAEGGPGFGGQFDLNRDTRIDVVDSLLLRLRLGDSLPPAPPGFAVTSAGQPRSLAAEASPSVQHAQSIVAQQWTGGPTKTAWWPSHVDGRRARRLALGSSVLHAMAGLETPSIESSNQFGTIASDTRWRRSRQPGA